MLANGVIEQPLTPQTVLPGTNTNVRINVYCLEAPLSFAGAAINRASYLKPDYIDVNAFHMGLGFSYEGSENYEFAVDLIAETFNINVLFPIIVDNKLVWKNKAIITYYTAIDREYWAKSTYVGTITGIQLAEWHAWIFDTYYPANPMYVFFSVAEKSSPRLNLIKRTVCDTFAEDSIEYMKSRGALIDYITPIHTSFTPILVANRADIVKLDASDPAVYCRIVEFYRIVLDIIHGLEGQFVRAGDIHAARDIFSYAKLFGTLANKFPSIVLYSYDEQNLPCYYQISRPSVFLNYIVSSVQRNVVGLTVTGTPYYDEYTPKSNALPVAKSNALPVAKSSSPSSPVLTSKKAKKSSVMWIVLVVFLLLVVGSIVLFSRMKKK